MPTDQQRGLSEQVFILVRPSDAAVLASGWVPYSVRRQCRQLVEFWEFVENSA